MEAVSLLSGFLYLPEIRWASTIRRVVSGVSSRAGFCQLTADGRVFGCMIQSLV